jgi:hypothetical protein
MDPHNYADKYADQHTHFYKHKHSDQYPNEYTNEHADKYSNLYPYKHVHEHADQHSNANTRHIRLFGGLLEESPEKLSGTLHTQFYPGKRLHAAELRRHIDTGGHDLPASS